MFANNFGENTNVCCGLVKIIKGEEEWEPPIKSPVPLISVNVKASVVHSVAQVEVTQVYVNKEEQPIEAIYYFPVDPDGAVTDFQAELEGRVIKGTVKPHKEAQEAYDNAVKEQITAILGEETKADIFKVRVGFLKPGSQVKVVIGYVTEVKNEPGSNAIRFYIPTTIAPRYVSPSETDDKAKDIKNMTFCESSPAPLSLTVAVSLQGGIKSIDSPTHKVTVNKMGPIFPENGNWHKALVELSGQTTEMDRDFVLNIVPEEVHKPRLYTEKGENGSTTCMVHLVPSFRLNEQKTELIFVLDRSGSMSGQSINLAKRALLLFLHSMPADCYFNIVGFGSTYKFHFPSSVKYNDKELRDAVAHAECLTANLGGTEILQPLKEIYAKPGIDGYLRQLFILTDGEVSDTDRVLGIAKANANKARVFALGIGDGASHHLVEGIAKAGGGTAAFVTYKERFDKKVLNQLKNALQPSLTDIELEWEGVQTAMDSVDPAPLNTEKTLLGYNKPIGETTNNNSTSTAGNLRSMQSPKKIPPVYDGSQMLVFGLFNNGCPTAVTIKAQSPDGPLTVKIESSSANDVGQTCMLQRLAAIKLVRELEMEMSAISFQGQGPSGNKEDELKKEIIEVACENGITSKYTSFVAIDVKQDKPSVENWVMETRNVPSQYAHGWHGGIVPINGPADLCLYDADDDLKLRGSLGFNTKLCKKSRSISVAAKCSSALQSLKNRFSSGSARRQEDFSRPRSHPATAATYNLGKTCDFMLAETVTAGSNESEDPSSNLLQLIRLQSFDGSYTLNEKLAAVIGKSLKKIKDAAVKGKFGEEVFATALAISYFVTSLSDEEDVWELVVSKAKKWLAKAMQPAQVEGVIQAATTFLAEE